MGIANKTALELGAQIKSGEVGVVEIVSALVDRIGTQGGGYNAFITVAERETLLARAAEVQKRIENGALTSPLAGVPIGIKDNICTEGLLTTCASKMLHNFIPPYSATAVERLEEAGMILIGKLNMDEFAMGSTSETSYFGPVKNPWDCSRSPGGSSGGSAAAVAGGEVFASLGTETGGSIRLPASHCGVTGFKPSYGTVSRYGAVAYASSLDQIGPIGRDVADCAALLDLIKGKDPKDSLTLDLEGTSYLQGLDGKVQGKRLALPQECLGDNVDEDVKKALLQAAETFRGLGAEVEYVHLPFLDYVIPAYYILATAEASSNLARFDGVKYGFRAPGARDLEDLYQKTRGEGFGAEVQKRILLGTFVLSAGQYESYYQKALRVKALIKGQFDEIFSKFDAILCPTTPQTAPLLGKTDALKRCRADIFTAAVNLAGLPGLSVPCGFDGKGLPIGAQLIGPYLADGAVLNLGYAFQSVTDAHRRVPEERGEEASA